MARIPVSFAYGPKDLLPSTHRIGTFYAVTDEGEQRLYVDLPDGKRLPMGVTEASVVQQLNLKMDKFGTYSNNILAINSGVVGTYNQSKFRIADINNIGVDISTQGDYPNEQNYVRLEYAGPSGSYSGLDVRVLDTPISDGSAVSKSYVQQHISTLNTKVNSLISTAVKREICDGGLPFAYLEAEPNTIYMLYNDLRETVGDNVGVNTYDEYIFTNCDPQINHFITSEENVGSPIILDPTPLDIGKCVVTGLEQQDGSIQVTFTTTRLSDEPAGVKYVLVIDDSADNPARLPIINSYESAMGEVWDVSITDGGDIQLTSYENSAFFELIGNTKCDLSGFVRVEQYNELKSTVDDLISTVQGMSEQLTLSYAADLE